MEDWDKMTTIKGGKFCAHCKEQVVDFANLSDTEIARLIVRNKGHLCGRLNYEQLGREIIIPTKENHYSFFTKATAALLLFTTGKEAKGQLNSPVNSSAIYTDKLFNKNTLSYNNFTPIEITGTVFDASTNKPISNARIIIAKPIIAYNFPTSYKTDNEGSFSIVLPDSTEKRTIELIIAAEGYQENTVKVSSEDYSTQINVYLSNASSDFTINVPENNIKGKLKTYTIDTTYIKKPDSVNIKHPKRFNIFNLFKKKNSQ